MRILWITFRCIGYAGTVFGYARSESGGWIDALSNALFEYKRNKEIELHILALGDRNETKYDSLTNVFYHIVDINYLRSDDEQNVKNWHSIIQRINPDLIQIWGTEFPFGKAVEKASADIPVLFYIQGIINVLHEHPAGDISLFKLLFENHIFAIPRYYELLKEIKRYKIQSKIELDMVKQSAGIIVDSKWAAAQYLLPDDKIYYHSLPVNEVFYKAKWSIDEIEKHTIFTVAGKGGLIKGLHNLLYAVAILKRRFPEIKLYVPGASSSRKPSFIFDTICVRHLNRIIRKYNLQNNVVFVGKLSPEEMKEYICKCNVFVMPSCVENHSSSLREAMYCGCPSIASDAGSAFEFVCHSYNGFIYRYNEFKTLAYYIQQFFDDDELASRIGTNARSSIREKYTQDSLGDSIVDIYSTVISKCMNLK